MKKYLLFCIISCLLLAGCNKASNLTPAEVETWESVTDVQEKETTTEPEKPISEYKDNTAKVSDTFVPEGVDTVLNGNLFHPEWVEIYSDLSELCGYAGKKSNVSIVMGEVTKDIAYVGQYEEYSENHLGDSYGSTVYTFAVKEVLYGEDVEPESLITVFEPMNGYMKHKDKEGVYYYTAVYGNIAVEQGDKYVMFLQKGTKQDEEYYGIEGDVYYPVGWYMGKYTCCDDGMYRRYSPASVDGLYHGEGEKIVFEEPMDIETIESFVAEYLKSDNSGISSREDRLSEQEETILYSQKIDLDENGTMEEIQVVALGKADAGKPETVEQLIEDGGLIKFYVLDENGNVYKSYGNDSEKTLYKEMYGNLQIFLTRDEDGNEVILVTEIMENRWMGCYEFNIYDVWQSRGSQEVTYGNYYTKSVSERTENDRWYSNYVSFTKMKKNPLDTMENARTSVVPEFKDYLEPWMEDAVLLVSVDALHDPVVMYSTKENQIPAGEYFDEVWNRKETFVEGEGFHK